jgi:glycosyltransferase involved in cell wall biosynthesis
VAKVGIVAETFAAKGTVFGGGAERQTYQLARLAIDNGADVTVYQPASGLPSLTTVEGVTVCSLPTDIRGIWSSATRRAVADGCNCIHYQYLVHVPRMATELNATATQFAIHWDIPFDPRYAAWYPHGRLARFYLGPWRRLHKRRCLRAIRRCREVLADSTSLLRLVQSDLPELRNKIYCVPNFSDISPNTKATPTDAKVVIGDIEEAKREGRLIVLVPRNLSFKQGIAFLPTLAENVDARTGSACQFVVTGQFIRGLPQSSHFERQLESALASMPPTSRARLTFLHGVDHKWMTYWYGAADIVLLPSFASEGTPLAAIEAMTFGKAIVATNIGGLNDLIDYGHTGFLVRPTVDDLARAIHQLASDAGLRARLGIAARDKAQSQFSLEVWRSSVLPFIDRNHWLA